MGAAHMFAERLGTNTKWQSATYQKNQDRKQTAPKTWQLA